MAAIPVRNVILLGKANAGKKTILHKFSTPSEPFLFDTHSSLHSEKDPKEACTTESGPLQEALGQSSKEVEGNDHSLNSLLHSTKAACSLFKSISIVAEGAPPESPAPQQESESSFSLENQPEPTVLPTSRTASFGEDDCSVLTNSDVEIKQTGGTVSEVAHDIDLDAGRAGQPIGDPNESSDSTELVLMGAVLLDGDETQSGLPAVLSENSLTFSAIVLPGTAVESAGNDTGDLSRLSDLPSISSDPAEDLLEDHSIAASAPAESLSLAIKIINPLGEQDEGEDEDEEDALSQVEADRIIANLFNEKDISCILICIEAQTRIPSIFSTLREYAKRFHKFVDIIAVCITKCDKKGENCWTNEHLKQKIESSFGLSNVVFWESSTTAAQMRSDLIGTDIFSLDCPPPRFDAESYFVSFPRNDYNPIKPEIMLREAVAKYQRLADAFNGMEDILNRQSAQDRAEAHSQVYSLLIESLERDKQVFEVESGLEIKSALAEGHLRNLQASIMNLFPRLQFHIESRSESQSAIASETRGEKKSTPMSKCNNCGKLWPAGQPREITRCGTKEPESGWQVRSGGYLVNLSTLEIILPFDSPDVGCGKSTVRTPIKPLLAQRSYSQASSAREPSARTRSVPEHRESKSPCCLL